ncbi:hypothetical protein DYQ86_23420 [Acidobacteria bacterium AB60]|nr:hypothetical protein DYQ86_23420 [Acidobacteria bacterium AB60]
MKGEPFSKRARFNWNGRKVTLWSSRTFLQECVEGSFGPAIFSINVKVRTGDRSLFAANIQADQAQLPIFTQDGRLSHVHTRLLEQPGLSALLAHARLQEEEGAVFTAGNIGIYLKCPDYQRARSVLQKVIDLADAAEIPEERLDLSLLPAEFHSLIPLIQTWAISDDLDREDALESSSDAELKRVFAEIEPYLPSINSYLDAFGAEPPNEQASALETMAELAAEIRLRLAI